jgi:hypothetical protein
MQKIFIKKYFLSTVGSVCRVKRFTTEFRNYLKDVRKLQMMPYQLQKWLMQQSKGCYAAGKAMEQAYQYWWRVCGEIHFLLQVTISHILQILSICDPFTDSPS